jgi:WD40 repeat protein
MSTALPSFKADSHVFSLAFHPTEQILAYSTVNGQVNFLNFDLDSQAVSSSIKPVQVTKASARIIEFHTTGESFTTATSDGRVSIYDMNPKRIWHTSSAIGVSSLLLLEANNSLIVGDDEGVISMFDTRLDGSKKPVMSWNDVQTDYISSLTKLSDREFISTSGDATLASFDLRSKKFLALSDEQEDELLSSCFVSSSSSSGEKILTGTESGVIGVWKKGYYGDVKDRVTLLEGTTSVEILRTLSSVKNKGTIITAGSDGVLRTLKLNPHRIETVLGCHDGEIEAIAVDEDLGLIASVGQTDQEIKFWKIKQQKKSKGTSTGSNGNQNDNRGKIHVDKKQLEKADFFHDLE